MFNYRSDRMRELTTVLGLPDKPMEVTVPEDLVSFQYLDCTQLTDSTLQPCRVTTRHSPSPWPFLPLRWTTSSPNGSASRVSSSATLLVRNSQV